MAEYPDTDEGRGSRALVRALLLASLSASLFLTVHRVANPAQRDAFAYSGVDTAMDDVFRRQALDRTGVKARPGDGAPAEVRAEVPPDASLAAVNFEITRAVEDAGGHVLDALEVGRDPEAPDRLDMAFGRGDAVTHRLTVRREPGRSAPTGPPRIAVVFDDLGYTLDGLAAELLALPARLTFAVLPGLPHSAEFAAAAAARGHEVILHLPMEPFDTRRHDPGGDALLVDLDPAENVRRLRRALDGFGGYIGVSNHMGSRFTSQPHLMEMVLREIRRRDRSLFFLDSATTPYSVVGEVARATGVRHLTNNLFLDGGDESAEPSRVRTDRVADIAMSRGHAVAIGHVHGETVSAVRGAIGRWQSSGIHLVALSDLMHR